MKPLSKGDTCRVRLHTGEVVEAVYLRDALDKDHWVMVSGIARLACRILSPMCVRFVGNPCVLLPVGASV